MAEHSVFMAQIQSLQRKQHRSKGGVPASRSKASQRFSSNRKEQVVSKENSVALWFLNKRERTALSDPNYIFCVSVI